MNKIDCTKTELLNILVNTEEILKSSRGTVLAIEWISSSKRKSTWKKKKHVKKQKNENRPKKEAPKKKTADKEKHFHCNNDDHWKRNYPIYMDSLKNKKDNSPSKGMLDLLVIENNLTISFTSSWIINSDSSAHVCTSI